MIFEFLHVASVKVPDTGASFEALSCPTTSESKLWVGEVLYELRPVPRST